MLLAKKKKTVLSLDLPITTCLLPCAAEMQASLSRFKGNVMNSKYWSSYSFGCSHMRSHHCEGSWEKANGHSPPPSTLFLRVPVHLNYFHFDLLPSKTSQKKHFPNLLLKPTQIRLSKALTHIAGSLNVLLALLSNHVAMP